MRVLCEKCNQQYIVNENDLKAQTSRFQCKKCSHFVVISRPESAPVEEEKGTVESESEFAASILGNIKEEMEGADNDWPDADQYDVDADLAAGLDMDDSGLSSSTGQVEMPATIITDPKTGVEGVPIQGYMSITFFLGFLLMALTIMLIYWQYVPELVNEQIDLRTAAISKSFSGAVKQPLLVRNYLRVNQEAERVSQLPGVAYASVINKRNIVIAGVFAKPSLFEPVFLDTVRQTGFPKELAQKNNLGMGEEEKSSEFTIGGQTIYDVAVPLGKVGGEVHVGLFTASIHESVKKSFVPLLISISFLFILGMIVLSLLARLISKPVQDLTEMADRISMGEIDEQVAAKGPREIRMLGRSLDRLRVSVRSAMKRLQR